MVRKAGRTRRRKQRKRKRTRRSGGNSEITAAERERLGVEHPRTSKLGKAYNTLNDWGKWYLFFTGEGAMLPGDGRREDERIIQRDANAKPAQGQAQENPTLLDVVPSRLLGRYSLQLRWKKKEDTGVAIMKPAPLVWIRAGG